METPTIALNTGERMPTVGFGTWQLGDATKDSVLTALDAGYRLIDTAKIYGNEAAVGEAIRESSVPRGEIFVTTKLWPSDFGYDKSLKAFDDSLQRLGLDYMDLYLIHWPNGDTRKDAWKALSKLHEQGKAKAVGVSNYKLEHLEELLKHSKLLPAVNQIEFHPFVYDEQKPVLEFCEQHGIVVEAYSPLAQGHELQNEFIAGLASSHSRSSAQIMLRWAVQHGTVPIPRSSNAERIKSNLDIFGFELSQEEMLKLDALSQGMSSLPA